jgi:hypothetical protein
VAVAVNLALLASCTDESDQAERSTDSSVTATPRDTGRAVTTSTAVSAPPPSTSTTTVTDVLPPCEPDMGSTLQEHLIGATRQRVPGGGHRGLEEGFDWDQDGRPDRLVIGDPHDVVTVDWGTGRLAVTHVHTDFTQPVTDEDGLEYVAIAVGPGTVEEMADAHRPAAVGDVTGDGWLDLIVTHRGTAAVLAGAGDRTPTGTISFDRLGLDTPGWRSPPSRGPQGVDGSGDPTGPSRLQPLPLGDVFLWDDVDGDGAGGFGVTATLGRGLGPLVVYAGVPCTTRP